MLETQVDDPFTKAQAESAYDQASVQDYGAVGDQRPYQIVHPAYPAPEFLQQFSSLTEALRECNTLCKSEGVPFRLVKWGSRVPCLPCKARPRFARLPSLRVRGYMLSRGALEGYPEATPLMEALPDGQRIVFGPNGEEQSMGQPDFKIQVVGPGFSVGVTDLPPEDLNDPAPLPTNYVEAIRGGEYLASRMGREAYICSSFGADCNRRDPKLWVPVVYVQPGGLARRYADQDDLVVGPMGTSSAKGSTTIVQPITPDMFQELLARGDGGSLLPWNAF